ncbi:MAG: hypothetical protein JWM10_5327 [Myxococcaceae bacterium]|nr:hypothetical protein [Myxococcaceae bacterium]
MRIYGFSGELFAHNVGGSCMSATEDAAPQPLPLVVHDGQWTIAATLSDAASRANYAATLDQILSTGQGPHSAVGEASDTLAIRYHRCDRDTLAAIWDDRPPTWRNLAGAFFHVGFRRINCTPRRGVVTIDRDFACREIANGAQPA